MLIQLHTTIKISGCQYENIARRKITYQKILQMNEEIQYSLRTYSEEQYVYAELLLTHGFTPAVVARLARMTRAAVQKISDGKSMHEIEMHLTQGWEDGDY